MESAKVAGLITVVIFVVVSAVLYPLIGNRVTDMTNESNEAYVGDDSAGLVSMIPVFYWLAVALVVIGVAIAAIRAGASGE